MCGSDGLCAEGGEGNGSVGISGVFAVPTGPPFSWENIKQSSIRNYTAAFTAQYTSLKALLGLLKLHEILNAEETEEEEEEDAPEEEVRNTTPSPALEDSPYSPKNVSRRQSKTREDLGLNKDPKSPIPDQSHGRNVKSTHKSDHKQRHDAHQRSQHSNVRSQKERKK